MHKYVNRKLTYLKLVVAVGTKGIAKISSLCYDNPLVQRI